MARIKERLVPLSVTVHQKVRQLTRHLGGHYGQLPPSFTPPAKRHQLELGEVSLSVLEWPGPEPTLLLLHGLNNNAWCWARTASLLSSKRRILAVSLRGHGTSSAPEQGYGLAHTTADLEALFEKLGLENVDLAGHSWGGKVACHFAATHPEKVRRLVLADPVPPKGLNRLIVSFPALIEASLRAERGPFASQSEFETIGQSILYLLHWDEWDKLLWSESFVQQPDGSLRHRLPESGYQELLTQTLGTDIRPLLGQIRSPILLLRPTLTLSFLPGEFGCLKRAGAVLEQKRVAGDHSFIHTNPIDTANQMESFLARPL